MWPGEGGLVEHGVQAMRNDYTSVVAAREWATGGISNLNPLPDHYFNNYILYNST
jgi:hypothetical protein